VKRRLRVDPGAPRLASTCLTCSYGRQSEARRPAERSRGCQLDHPSRQPTIGKNLLEPRPAKDEGTGRILRVGRLGKPQLAGRTDARQKSSNVLGRCRHDSPRTEHASSIDTHRKTAPTSPCGDGLDFSHERRRAPLG
jgi:hypothetical protein